MKCDILIRVEASNILDILDRCAAAFKFPTLDNGYVYLAATRASLFRSPEDWALVIEVFGYSPRSALPNVHIQTFASRLHERDKPERYVNRQAFDSYLASNPHNEARFFNPIGDGDWLDSESCELVAKEAKQVQLRGRPFPLPARDESPAPGIDLLDPHRIHVFELCRYIAAEARSQVLATKEEQRASVRPERSQIMQLDEWHHPDLVNDERPSNSTTFKQLARALETGDVAGYQPRRAANTHWQNWPDGGSL